MFNVTIFWDDPDRKPTRKENVTIEEGMVLLTIFVSDSEYSRIPYVKMLYYDVEVV